MKKVSNPALQSSQTMSLALESTFHAKIRDFLCASSDCHHLQCGISVQYLSFVISPDLQGCTWHSCLSATQAHSEQGV